MRISTNRMALTQKLLTLNRFLLNRSLISFSAKYCVRKSSTNETPKTVAPKPTQEKSPSTPVKTKVKQGVSDLWYSSIIVGGIALTGFIFYVIVNELFSSRSPTSVYEEALDICIKDSRVQEMLGSPITGCGESNRRGRRTHVATTQWTDTQGRKHMAMRFFLKGRYASATVHLEAYETGSKEMTYRYLVVEMDGLSRRQVILRPEEEKPSSPANPVQATLESSDK